MFLYLLAVGDNTNIGNTPLTVLSLSTLIAIKAYIFLFRIDLVSS